MTTFYALYLKLIIINVSIVNFILFFDFFAFTFEKVIRDKKGKGIL